MKSKIPGGTRAQPTKLKKARKFSPSSQRWLQRQLSDPYVTAAQKAGYRARAAFKLLELDEKFKLLAPGMCVVDLGAAPGGWLQVARKKIGAKGILVGIDLLPIEPFDGAIFLQMDFTTDEALAALHAALNGKQVDLVMSDMAAGTTGHAATDHLQIMALAELAFDFAQQTLRPGGNFICKLFQGGAEKNLQTQLKQSFKTVKYAKPPASRAESSETYLIALGFKPQASTTKKT